MQVVELYGLPGCGKTTTRQLLLDDDAEGRIVTIIDVADRFKEQKRLKKLSCIPLLSWFHLLWLIMSLPILPLKDWHLYRHMFVLVLLYAYAHKEKEVCLVVDHGIVQDVVGVLYGHANHIPQRALKVLCHLLGNTKSVSFVFCHIDKETSLQRIRQRNRQDEGRLDTIKDDSVLASQLAVQDSIFNNIYDGILSCKSCDGCKVEMEQESEEITMEVKEIIRKNYV